MGKANKLKKLFAEKFGVTVKVVTNKNIEGNGKVVENQDGTFTISVHPDRLTKDTATKLVKGADIVLMETDTTSSTLLLHKIARKYKVPLINGHCYQVVKGKIHIFDYRNLKQRDFDEPTPFKAINSFAQRFLKCTRKPFDEMSDEEIMRLDNNLTSYPAVNFTTNMVGCLVVAETIKFITSNGSTCLHPKEIDIDLFKRKMRVSSAFSFRYSFDFIIRHWDQITDTLKWPKIKKVV